MSGLQHKMYNYEVTPPAGVWEKIAAELDEAELEYHYPSRLHELEVAPPAGAWQKIKSSLESEQKALVPERRRLSPFIRYAAAAAILAFLVWGGMQLFNNKKNTGTDMARQEQVNPVQNNPAPETNLVKITPEETIPVTSVAVSAEDARDNAALEASKKTFASLSTPRRTKIREVSNFYFVPEIVPAGTRGVSEPSDYYPAEFAAEENIADRYFMLMTPEGNIIRMSKKLGSLVCCVSGEEQDEDCIRQMKKWKEKMATPSAGHSPGNFMDILSLLNSLQENNL